MNTFGKMILGSAFATLAMTTTALADTTLNALFMSQAAYSEDDIKSMTAKFEEANPASRLRSNSFPMKPCTTRSLQRQVRAMTGMTLSCST